MDFKQLKELSTDEQISWLNSKLSEGLTVSEIRNILGIGERALQKHVKSISYKYNQRQKKYIPAEQQQDNGNVLALQNHTTGGKVVNEGQQDNSNTLALQLENSDYKKFIHIMNTYEELQRQVQELIKKQELEDNVIDVTPPKLEITPMDKKPISKTYKFNPDVVEEFTKFCNKHKNYKVQDIISKALQEFIDKYGR